MSTPASIFDPAHVAMLVGGQEIYGIGTIEKLYAENYPGMLFVTFGPGAMTDWLAERGHRLVRHDGLQQFSAARSSLQTLAVLPGKLRQAKTDAVTLAPILHGHGIRAVHTQWPPQQFVAGHLRKRGFKTFWQINNPTNRDRLFGLGLKLNHRLARWGADMILPASDYIAHNWHGCGSAVRTIRNAALPVYDEPPPARTTPARTTLPLRCLTAGRITEQKGHHHAVQAVAAARDAGHDVRLDCFGAPVKDFDKLYADRLKELAGEHFHDDGIRLMGLVNDLRQRHRNYDLGLQVRTDPEPCSLWVCETLVDGLPLLATATGGTPELVDDNVTGRLFQPGDVATLTRHLIDLAEHPETLDAMAQAAWHRGAEHFRVDRMMRETAEAYAAIA